MMMAVGALLFSTTQLIPQLLQTTFGYTATLSGLALMPGGLAMLSAMPIAGALGSRLPPRLLLTGGMLAVAAAMWHATSLSPTADFSFFAWVRVFQTIALPFLFVPITSAAYTGLPPGKTDEASSLVNVARNLGGSIGISITTTILARNSQMHQDFLAAHLVPSSPQYQQALTSATDMLVKQGMPQVQAQSGAIGLIGRMVGQQAEMLAYVDVFALLAIAAVGFAALALILMRNPPRQAGAAVPVHVE